MKSCRILFLTEKYNKTGKQEKEQNKALEATKIHRNLKITSGSMRLDYRNFYET